MLLGGQPGAGKSTAAHRFEQEFAPRGGLVVDGDDFRPLHPAYEHLLAERPQDMPEAIQDTVRWWLDRATDHLWPAATAS